MRWIPALAVLLLAPTAAQAEEIIPYPDNFWETVAANPEAAVHMIRDQADACERAKHPDKRCAMLFLGHGMAALMLAEKQPITTQGASAPVQRAYDYLRETFRPDPSMFGMLSSMLGKMRMLEQRYEDAEVAFRDAYEANGRIAPRDPSAIIGSLGNIAAAIAAQGRATDATPLYAQALAIARAEAKPDEMETAIIVYATNLDRAGRSAEAEPLFREVLATAEKREGPEHYTAAEHMLNLGRNLTQLGKYAEAETLLRRALAIYGALHWKPQIARTNIQLATLFLKQGRHVEAEAFALDGAELTAGYSGDDIETLQAHTLLAQIWSRMPERPSNARKILAEVIAGWIAYSAQKPGFTSRAQRELRGAAPLALRQVAVNWTLAHR